MAAYRLPYLLAGDSVVLKQDSSYYEHFYNELRPWTHYIPISADLGDLLEKIKWAREHDEEVMIRKMADIRFGSECTDICCNSLRLCFLLSCRLRKLHWQVSSLPARILWETKYFVTTTNFSR